MTEPISIRAVERERTTRTHEVVEIERVVEVAAPTTGRSLQRGGVEPQTVTGRRIPPSPPPARVVTVVVTDYGGHSREEAAAQVREDWQAHHADAVVQVVHADDGWEPVQ